MNTPPEVVGQNKIQVQQMTRHQQKICVSVPETIQKFFHSYRWYNCRVTHEHPRCYKIEYSDREV